MSCVAGLKKILNFFCLKFDNAIKVALPLCPISKKMCPFGKLKGKHILKFFEVLEKQLVASSGKKTITEVNYTYIF